MMPEKIFSRGAIVQMRDTAFRGAGVPPAVCLLKGHEKSPARRRRHKKASSWHGIEVVAVAGQHGKAGALHAHLDGVIGLRTIGLGGRVSERVLIASLFGDARIEPFQVLAARSVKNIST